MFKALILSSLVLNLGLFLGRLSGFARESLIATTYGATAQADIVVLMLTVPDILVNILMGGALGAVLVPEFNHRGKQARQLLYQSLLYFCVLFLGLTIFLYWQIDMLIAVMAPGFSESQVADAMVSLRWVIWLIPLTVMSGVVTAYLHAQHKFAVAALGTLIINSVIILGLWLIHAGYGAMQLLAYFVILGGLLRLFSQLSQVKISWTPFSSLRKNLIDRAIFKRYSQAMLSGSVLLMLPVVAKALASYEGEGSVALFNYSIRLVEFPLAIAVTFLAVIFFPRLAQSYKEDANQHRQLIRYGVQITLVLSIMASIALVVLSDIYASIVYGYGDMNNSSLSMVSMLAVVGLIGLPFQGLAVFLTAIFNARKNTLTPMLVNLSALLFFLLVSEADIFGGGLVSLMWCIVASYALACVCLLLFLKIDSLSWWKIIFDRSFLPGLISSVLISVSLNLWIVQANLSTFLSLFLAGMVFLFSLLLMSLLHKKLRGMIKMRLSRS